MLLNVLSQSVTKISIFGGFHCFVDETNLSYCVWKNSENLWRQTMNEDEFTERIVCGPDGVYRWRCDLNLFSNPTILLMFVKMWGVIVGGLFLLTVCISIDDPRIWQNGLWELFTGFILFYLGMLILTVAGYAAYAVYLGGKYCVLFEMSPTGLLHAQTPKQFKRAQVIGKMTTGAGMASGNLSMIGNGIKISAARTVYSEFRYVSRIRVYRKRGVIKLSAVLCYNQIYIGQEDFDFVLNYIVSHCKKKHKNRMTPNLTSQIHPDQPPRNRCESVGQCPT